MHQAAGSSPGSVDARGKLPASRWPPASRQIASMERIRATLRSELGWFDRAYIIDWYVHRRYPRQVNLDAFNCRIVTFLLFVFSQTVNRTPVYQRDIELVLNDPSIAHPHGKAQ